MDEELRIRSIAYQGSTASVLKIELDDASLMFLDADHPAASLAQAFRNSADLLDEASIQTLRQADECYRCRRKAMDLLARSEQCRRGLESKLSRKGWSRESVQTALDRLEAAGYLDDHRFAESWVRSRLRSRPEGPSRLIGGLMAKGINGGVAREAVDAVMEELGDDAADEALERAYQKIAGRRGMSDEKLVSSLVRRGFRISDIRRLLRQHAMESRED